MKTLNKLIILLTILAFIFFGMAIKTGNQCLENPLTYGASKMSTEDTGNFSCFCSFTNQEYEGVYFDKEDISTVIDYIS